MGTMIQGCSLTEAHFRGDRFGAHTRDLQGNNDLLGITQPDVIEEDPRRIFRRRGRLGRDQHLQRQCPLPGGLRHGRSRPGDQLPAAACAAALSRPPGKTEAAFPGRRAVSWPGALGPTSRTLSLSPDVNRPDYRSVTWDQLIAAYTEQGRTLVAAGVDAILIEDSSSDTLNAKAALFRALDDVFAAAGQRPLPVMISSHHHRQFRPHPVRPDDRGLLHEHRPRPAVQRRHQLRAGRPGDAALRRGTVSRLASCYVIPATPMPGCPTPSAATMMDPRPGWPGSSGEFAGNGWLNLVGGCCGSTPAHIAAIAAAVLQPPAAADPGRDASPAPERLGSAPPIA